MFNIICCFVSLYVSSAHLAQVNLADKEAIASIEMRSDGEITIITGKAVEEFRNYRNSTRQEIVEHHYRLMRTYQGYEFSGRMQQKWGTFDKARMTIREAFTALLGYVDSSDPDSSLPNMEHMFQTAEGIRAEGYPGWMQLTGLLHDMGKIQYLWGTGADGQEGTADGDQWALGGDTWVTGCRIPDTVVFPEFNPLNVDYHNPMYNKEYGVYSPHIGMKNLRFAWGHDEYLYQMLRFNNATLPEEAYAMIRYHSCYPWHTHGAYTHLMVESDKELIEWVRTFNQFDLYTKADIRPDPEALWPYYQTLIDQYVPGSLYW